MMVRSAETADKETLDHWANGWEVPPMTANLFYSGIGFVAYDEKLIAACWLYLGKFQTFTELHDGKNFAIIDNLICDPKSDKKKRSLAIDACVESARAEARLRGACSLYALTMLPEVVRRAQRLGFDAKSEAFYLLKNKLEV